MRKSLIQTFLKRAKFGKLWAATALIAAPFSLKAQAPPQTPYQVKDLNATPGNLSSTPENFISIGNTMYFTATSSLQGNELWITDGTGAGTVMVKDIKTGIGGS